MTTERSARGNLCTWPSCSPCYEVSHNRPVTGYELKRMCLKLQCMAEAPQHTHTHAHAHTHTCTHTHAHTHTCAHTHTHTHTHARTYTRTRTHTLYCSQHSITLREQLFRQQYTLSSEDTILLRFAGSLNLTLSRFLCLLTSLSHTP